MKGNRLESWLQNIYHTQAEEISCSECFDGVSQYVEIEVEGGDAAGKMPQLKQHLDQCAACREEYQALRDLKRLENEGNLPSLDDLQDLIR